jgi:hypothetical protein
MTARFILNLRRWEAKNASFEQPPSIRPHQRGPSGDGTNLTQMEFHPSNSLFEMKESATYATEESDRDRRLDYVVSIDRRESRV